MLKLYNAFIRLKFGNVNSHLFALCRNFRQNYSHVFKFFFFLVEFIVQNTDHLLAHGKGCVKTCPYKLSSKYLDPVDIDACVV